MSRIPHVGRVGLWLAAVVAAGVLAGPAVAGAHQRWGTQSRTFGATSLTLNPGAASALTSLGVTPGVISPAAANSDGSLSFPITDPLPAALATGRITHLGGISLTAGSTEVDLINFNINLRRQTLSALVGGSRVPILSLDYAGATVGFGGGQLSIGPVTAALTQTAADALNSAFHVTAFTPGLVLGTATVRYRLLP